MKNKLGKLNDYLTSIHFPSNSSSKNVKYKKVFQNNININKHIVKIEIISRKRRLKLIKNFENLYIPNFRMYKPSIDTLDTFHTPNGFAVSKFSKLVNYKNRMSDNFTKNITGSYKKISDQFDFNNTFFKNIQKALKLNRKLFEISKERYPKQKEIIDILYKNGWALGNYVGDYFEIYSNPEEVLKLSEEEICKNYSDYYIKKCGIFEELDNIEKNVILHKQTIKYIRNTLKSYENSWHVLFPQLFAIADAMIISICHDGDLKNKDITNWKAFGILKNKFADNKMNDEIFKYGEFKTLEMAEKSYFKGTSFAIESERVKFSRHSVQHGRYDPNNYSYEQFAKLIVFISSLSILEMQNR